MSLRMELTMTNKMSTPHAVVVGAGLGGMAAAIRLRGRGYRVTLVEANEQLGGRASVFKQDGYIFDAGPTVVTAPYLFDEVFESVGRKTTDYFETVPVDPRACGSVNLSASAFLCDRPGQGALRVLFKQNV